MSLFVCVCFCIASHASVGSSAAQVARVPLPTLPSSSRITSLLFSPDSSRLYAATSACAVCVLSLSPSSSSLAPSSALLAVFDVLSGETNAPGAAADSAGEEEEDEEDEGVPSCRCVRASVCVLETMLCVFSLLTFSSRDPEAHQRE